ncbi:flavin monoamine oxidase family protein [Thalassobacillus sp. CUG 92003]|uniref:flavin monoamine oxidase family protein n=1 Tax=Thalassobacillus sp. CUG 92003 TaxID=2736641 RepID=UPI0015E6595F|nr:flavin monoamine oxidase family protein [Thalassobacillus sp. CUG 92003]
MYDTRETEYAELSYPDDKLAIIRNGLPPGTGPKRIVIAGAGMAGLIAGSLLKEAGHHVTLLEGNQRIGGRIFTLRQPFTAGNYLDMGAMRIPDTHKLVFEYIKKFNLPTNVFRNTTPEDMLVVNGIQAYVSQYEENPDLLDYPLPPEEQGKTASELFLAAVQPFIDLYNNSSEEQKALLRKNFDRYSFDNFLRFNPIGPSLSPNAIRMIKVILGIEGFPEFSFVDILLDIVSTIFNEELKFYEITGGNDQLPLSFLPLLKENILCGQKVTRLEQAKDSVTMYTRETGTGKNYAFEADAAIVTLPYSVFQYVDVVPFDSFSFKKWKAIRELNYVPSVKIGIEFRDKFWEKAAIGNITSDEPIRFIYPPSHGIGEKGPGVLLASYSWGQNALLWNSLPVEEQIREVLNSLAKMYGNQVYASFLQGASFNWSQNPFSAGCFTLYTPNQETDLAEAVHQPEGRVHFAGEHTSEFHGWIEGAVESGIRAAYEVQMRSK